MEWVRKNEQNRLPKQHRKFFKRCRNLLMKPMENLSEDEKNRLALMLNMAPRLADAYRVKNDFIRSSSSKKGRKRLTEGYSLRR